MFDDIIEDGVNVLIDFTHTVNIVRVLGNAMMPARLTIKAQVLPSQDAIDIDFEITFAKIKFWFANMVARTVIFKHDNENARAMFLDADNKPRILNYLMMTPSEPTDEHIGALFQSKMTALSGGIMDFGVVRVNSESDSGLVWSYVGDWREDLPNMSDWFSTKPYYFDIPWWERDDTSTLDIIANGTTDFTKSPAWAFNLDFIENAIRPHMVDETAESPSDGPDPVVIRGTFRPKVIDGGSDE